MDLAPSKKSDIIKKSIDLNIEVLETPAIEKWLNGQLEVRQLTEGTARRSAGKRSDQLNMEIIRKGLAQKTILVTGAAGSIGSEIVRQLSRFSTK